MTLEVRRLAPDDDRRSFVSGHPDLDRFFIKYAGQNQFRHHLGTTWIAVDDERIRGFVTVLPGEIRASTLPEGRLARLPAYPLPVLRIARLAVAEDARGQGVGSALMRAAFIAARRLATEYGCVGVLVDAKAEAIAFYERYGFESITISSGELGDRPMPQPMFLELGAIPSIE